MCLCCCTDDVHIFVPMQGLYVLTELPCPCRMPKMTARSHPLKCLCMSTTSCMYHVHTQTPTHICTCVIGGSQILLDVVAVIDINLFGLSFEGDFKM